MTPTTIKIVESAPSGGWPTITLRKANPALLNAAWQRVDSYTGFRWGVRNVVYYVNGVGEWTPPLEPTTITSSEIWDSAWQSITLGATPFGGLDLKADGKYRLTGTVGDTAVPPEVIQEAVRRLAEYFQSIVSSSRISGAMRSYEVGDAEVSRVGAVKSHFGDYSETAQRLELVNNWTPRAIQLSGAADLLRPYRKLGVA